VSDGVKRNYTFWSLILLFLYYSVDLLTPLGNWKGEPYWPVHNDQFSPDLIVGLVLLVAIFGFRANFRAGMILGTAQLGLWTHFHLETWWVP